MKRSTSDRPDSNGWLPQWSKSVSIVIVNRNGGSLLDPCFTSALPQGRDPAAEVLVVDNTSPDGRAD